MATIASLAVNLIAQTSKFTQPLKSAEKAVRSFAGATERVANRVQSLAQSVDSFASSAQRMTVAMTAIAGVSVSASVSFDRAMAQVRAVSGATAEQFRALRDEAERLGRETKFSAREIAEGFGFLAMAGMDVETMIGAGERVTRLAAAANIDLASSADIVTNIMAGFRMEVSDLDRAVDSLTKAFTSANVDLHMLGESMKYVGPVAEAAGAEFEEIVAAVAMLGDVGIQGSEAGTALRRAISILIAPTSAQERRMRQLGLVTRDANGQFVGLANVLEQLERMGADAADIMSLFEQRAGSAMTALIGGSARLRQFSDELRSAGGWAEQVATVQMEGFQGQLVVFQSQIESARIAIGRGLTPALSVLVGWLQSGLQLFLDMEPAQRQNIIRWAALTGAVLAAASTLGILARVLVGGATILRTFGQVLSFVFSPLVMYTALAIGAIALFRTAWENDWFGIRTAITNAWENHIKPVWERLKEPLKSAWEWAVDIVGTAWEWIVDTTWAEKLEDIKGWMTAGWEWVVDIAGTAWDWLTETTWAEKLDDIRGWLSSAWEWTLTLAGNAWTWIEDNLPWVAATVEKLRDWLSTAWDWTINLVGDAWEWLTEAIPDSLKDLGAATLRLIIEPFGELYNAIKTGLETGDWSGIWGVAAEAWRSGIKIAVSLALAGGTAQMVLNGIRAGLGLLSAGAASVGALGMPGVLGVLSIGVALAEAMEGGDYQAFGDNLIAALAAGIGIGSFTGSPYLGALAFTIVLNFRVGEWIGDKLKEIDQSRFMRGVRGILGTGPTYEGLALQQMASGEYMTFADRETYLMPAPEKRSLTERIAIWWQNTELARWLSGDAPGSYQTGTPWTGWGPLDEVAGVVHRREAVIPWEALRKGPAGVLEFLGVPGFQTGYLPSGAMGVVAQGARTDGLLSGGAVGVVLGAGIGADPANDAGWVRTQFERILGEIESLIGADRASALRDMFGGLLNVTDKLEAELLRLWDALGQYEEEISDAIGSAQSLIESLDELMDEQQRATEYQLAFNSAMAQVLGRLPLLNQMLDAFVAGAAFGMWGSVIAAFGVLAIQSETMGHAFRMVNETLQTLANAVGMFLQPLLPIIHVVQSVLVPVFGVLGQVLASVLLPIMPFVFEAFRVVGMAVLLVAEMFQRARAFILDAVGGLVWGIGKFVDSLIGWLTGVGRDLMRVGDSLRQSADDARKSAEELADSRRDLIDLTYDEAMKRAQLTDEIERAVGGMINIPQGFRYALERMEAATPSPAPAGVVPTPTPAVVPGTPDISASAGLTGGGRVIQVHYHLHGDVYGWEDFKRKVQQADAEIRRDLGLSLHGFAGG